MRLQRQPQQAAILELVAQLGRGLVPAAQILVHAPQRVDVAVGAAQQPGHAAAGGLRQRVAGHAREGGVDPFDAVVHVGDGNGVVGVLGHQRELALLGLAQLQAFARLEELGHVGKGAHQGRTGQVARLHLDHGAARRAAQIGLGQRQRVAGQAAFECAAQPRVDQAEVGAELAVLDLIAHDLFHRRPRGEKGLRDADQLVHAPVVDARAAVCVHAQDALVDAVQRQRQGLALAAQLVRQRFQAPLVLEQASARADAPTRGRPPSRAPGSARAGPSGPAARRTAAP